jgi:hypothetical protein
MLFFQISGLAEAMLAAGEFSLLKRLTRLTALPSSFDAQAFERYVEQW